MSMNDVKKINEENDGKEDIGFMLWKLESIGKFYPCYKTMMGQE